MTTEVTEMTIDEQLDSLRSDVAHLADLKRVHADYHEDLRAELELHLAALAARLRDLESFKAQSYIQIQTLNEQVAAIVETQKNDESKGHSELRRRLKASVLADLLDGYDTRLPEALAPHDWEYLCSEAARRHPLLWAGPPKPPSPETRQLIAESLRRRQEA